MTITVDVEQAIQDVFHRDEATLEEYVELNRQIHAGLRGRRALEALVASFESVEKAVSSENRATVKKGIASWMLDRFEEATRELDSARAAKDTAFFLGLCLMELGRHLEAVEKFRQAYDYDSSSPLLVASLTEALILSARLDDAERLVNSHRDSMKPYADYHYLVGLVAEMRGERQEAQRAYEDALERHPEHPKVLFRRAYLADLYGDNELAEELYTKLRNLNPPHVNTLMNLGVFYEDKGDYDRAIECFEEVLKAFPRHQRALLYQLDARASVEMFYDEETRRREHQWNQTLNTPISEVPLSVRSKNALIKLDVQTLGDLVTKTEQDLLSVKSFGKTSLREIREMLASRGLELARPGEPAGMPPSFAPRPVPAPSIGDEILTRPLSDLEWSARARKALERLRLDSVGDLVAKSEQELLAVKNFGQTSLNEVKQKLATLGLSLAKD